MKELLEKLLEGETLASEEARLLMSNLLEEPVKEAQIAAFVTALRIRGVRASELEGFADALLDLAITVDLSDNDTIDVCGTGGDSKGAFNISTATAFVLAGAGYKVAKHGNYGVSSSCGSSNVLEALGITFSTDRSKLLKAIEETNVCFLHAPLFHPALKRIQPIRKELGFRTVFNMLGPLVNPTRPGTQMNGVYSNSLLRLYQHVLSRRGTRFTAFHSQDGYDEITLTAPIMSVTKSGEGELTSHHFQLPQLHTDDIKAPTTIEESARLIVTILEGRGTAAQEAVVSANAALAMFTHEEKGALPDYVARATAAIKSGKALDVLKRSIELA
jgi:anthranilate phosphoribosyltransferase